MKNSFFLCLLIFTTSTSFAQKKMIPVTKSALTGISLPAGSLQDKRMLSVSIANSMMEMESKKVNITLSNTEVLVFPAVSLGGDNDNKEIILKSLTAAGWHVSENEGDKDYSWLQKGNQSLMMYFSSSKKESNLYFALASPVPIQNTQQSKASSTQTIPVENKPTQQSANPPVQTNSGEVIQQPNRPVPASAPSGFAFSTTNFDDGWTSTVQEDWVEVKRGDIKVLLHYPKEGTVFPADPEPLTNGAWNILVAPRYKNLKNYKTTYISTYNRPYLGMGYATEIATEKNVFIVFFLQERAWIEFITPDKNTFIQQFKFDPETIQWDSESDLMIPLSNMTRYNKFAISSSDLKGKWTSDFTGIQQMYYVYTGQYAGMNMNQSNEEFNFNEGNTYSWKLLVIKGMVGDAKYTEVKSSGKFEVPNNWQVKFSMIETRARTYHAYWSCIKDARILNLLDADYPGSGIYEKFGLAK